LQEVLSPNVAYHVEFYLSLEDSLNYAVKNVGAYFSQEVPTQNLEMFLSLTPQISYEGAEFLTDKEGWMKISGSFVAVGGERYLTIGNFDDDENTDSLFVEGGGVL